MRLLSPIPEPADITSIHIARSTSVRLTVVTPSSTIRAADIDIPVTGKILFNLPAPKRTSIVHQNKFAGDQVEILEGVVECSQQVSLIFTGVH